MQIHRFSTLFSGESISAAAPQNYIYDFEMKFRMYIFFGPL